MKDNIYMVIKKAYPLQFEGFTVNKYINKSNKNYYIYLLYFILIILITYMIYTI